MDQNVDRVTWTAIILAIGITLYALCLPFFKSIAIQPFNIAGQTPFAVSSADCDTSRVFDSGVSLTKNNDGSFSLKRGDLETRYLSVERNAASRPFF